MEWILCVVIYTVPIIITKCCNRYIHKIVGYYSVDTTDGVIILLVPYIPLFNWIVATVLIFAAIDAYMLCDYQSCENKGVIGKIKNALFKGIS